MFGTRNSQKQVKLGVWDRKQPKTGEIGCLGPETGEIGCLCPYAGGLDSRVVLLLSGLYNIATLY